MARSRSGSVVLALAVLAGCGAPEPTASFGAIGAPNVVAGKVELECGGTAFDAALVSAPGSAENGTDDLASALRAVLVPGDTPAVDLLPATGWHRIKQDDAWAQFVHFGVEPTAFLEFRRIPGGGWSMDSRGYCLPTVVLPSGALRATWELDPVLPAPDARSTRFTVLVKDRGCAALEHRHMRISGGTVQLLDDRVYVVFAVKPLGGDGACPGDPPASVTVMLGEPLGDRRLMDPGTLFAEG